MMLCDICGRSETEVKKLFQFPRNPDKFNRWQAALGIKKQNPLSPYSRICENHFTKKDCCEHTLVLRPTAVPFKYDLQSQKLSRLSVEERVVPTTTFSNRSQLKTPLNKPAIKPAAFSRRGKKSLFKDVSILCSGNRLHNIQKLKGIVKRKHKHLRQLKKKVFAIGQPIKNWPNIENDESMRKIFESMSPSTVSFMISQIRRAKRSPAGTSWSLDEKVMALAIMKRTPNYYALLQRLLGLPSKKTLELMLDKVPFDVGINKHMLDHLGKCVKTYESIDRYCTIAFREMAIRKQIQYNCVFDIIEGVEDLGNGQRDRKLASYALVFVAQGISKPWMQPIAYYFSRGRMNERDLENCIKNVLDAMRDVGIPVISTICDMSTSNLKALKNMGSSISDPYFVYGGRCVFTIFDVPDLLRRFRNSFRKYNVVVPNAITLSGGTKSMKARWSDLVKAHDQDKKTILKFRYLYKLKDFYLNPIGHTAMDVKVAAQTLSRSMSIYLSSMVQREVLPTSALATATLLNRVDEVFDSLNARSSIASEGKPFNCAVSEKSGHLLFWEGRSKEIAEWRFIRKPLGKRRKQHWKPRSQLGWLHSLNAFQMIWSDLKYIGFENLKTRSLNQNSLRNLFTAVRSGCNKNPPTVAEFVSSLKTQVLNNLACKETFCAEYEREEHIVLVSNLRSYLEDGESTTKATKNILLNSNINLSVATVAGIILRTIRENITCFVCRSTLATDVYNQISAVKEYNGKFIKFIYPSERIVICVGDSFSLLEAYLVDNIIDLGIRKKACDLLDQQVDFSWLSCTIPSHVDIVKRSIIMHVSQIGIPWFCGKFVRDLNSESRKK